MSDAVEMPYDLTEVGMEKRFDGSLSLLLRLHRVRWRVNRRQRVPVPRLRQDNVECDRNHFLPRGQCEPIALEVPIRALRCSITRFKNLHFFTHYLAPSRGHSTSIRSFPQALLPGAQHFRGTSGGTALQLGGGALPGAQHFSWAESLPGAQHFESLPGAQHFRWG